LEIAKSYRGYYMEKIVTLNELNEIIKALDLYSRIDIGQYDEIVELLVF